MSFAPSPAGREKGGGATAFAGSDSSGAAPAGHGASPARPREAGDKGGQEGPGSLGASTDASPPLPPRPPARRDPEPTPRIPGSAEPPQPHHWVGMHVGRIAGPRTPKWRPRLEGNRQEDRQARARAPRRRAQEETEEGAQGKREGARGVRAGSGGRAVGVGGAGLTYLSSAPPLPVT